MIRITMILDDGNDRSKSVEYAHGMARLIDAVKTSKSFDMNSETSPFSGKIENYGVFFIEELRAMFALNVDVFARVLCSCDFLGINAEYYRLAIAAFTETLIAQGETAEKIELPGLELAEKILEATDVATLLLIAKRTTISGAIRLGKKDQIQLTEAILDELSDHFTIYEIDLSGVYGVRSIRKFAHTLEKLNISSVNGTDCSIFDSELEYATNLVDLNVSENSNVEYLGPCAKTLKILRANGSSGLKDNALIDACSIEELHVGGNRHITTVKPFAATLRKLEAAGGNCGITDAGLADAHSIVELNAWGNAKISTVAPFAGTLRKLVAGWFCKIGDAGLADAHWIEELALQNNHRITTLAPFAKTLKVLAAGDSKIDDEALKDAHWIEELDATNNGGITTVAPFAQTLRRLNASGLCGIDDFGLADAKNIKVLTAVNNERITTVAPFAETLVLLEASGRCGINDAALIGATRIEIFNAYENPRITTVAPFALTLRELYIDEKSKITFRPASMKNPFFDDLFKLKGRALASR